MYERIMIPLDGSEVGEAAMPFVEEIISKLGPDVQKEITLLQVLKPVEVRYAGGEAAMVNPQLTQEERERQTGRAMEYLNRVGESLKSTGATVSPKVAFGDAAEEIIKAADEIGANLIAMSTHGRSGLSRWAFGSVTDRVLRHTESVPILMVRARAKSK